jgi:2-dehydro-3-deoxygalactonokinase
MTGELFAVLSRNSILGRLMPEEEGADHRQARDAAFIKGVDAVRKGSAGDLAHQIFATRTLGLTRRLPAEALKDYLSGLLIGSELVSGLALMRDTLASDTPLVLIGEDALCERYFRALDVLGVSVAAKLENTAPRGLFQFATAAGLIPPPHSSQATSP